MIIAFWIFVLVFLYSYLGYTLCLLLLSILTGKQKTPQILPENHLPEITLMVAAYNEKEIIDAKINNSQLLNYPKNKLKLLWVTDGSNDGTPELLNQYTNVTVLHQDKRLGKTAAINRAMEYVASPIVVFSDANTFLNNGALINIASRFSDKKVGCVAGEKRIFSKNEDSASGAGEGFYWKYESFIKTLESRVGSCMGAVGELFALRTELFQKVPDNSIIDDFVISLTIALKGYKIDYAPDAFAQETASISVKDEMKRKVRIASGGFQTLIGMPQLLNIFKYGVLSWQYLSHKVSRWLLAPVALLLIFMLNLLIVYANPAINIYTLALVLQALFYLSVILGAVLKNQQTQLKFIFVPYYFFMMNYAQVLGLIKYIKGKHSVIWEKVQRQGQTNLQ